MEFELEELNDELEELNIELRNIKDINLLGKEITHKKFGNGKVVHQNGYNVTIQFNSEEKNLQAPFIFANNIAECNDKEVKEILSKIYKIQENIKLVESQIMIKEKEIELNKQKNKEQEAAPPVLLFCLINAVICKCQHCDVIKLLGISNIFFDALRNVVENSYGICILILVQSLQHPLFSEEHIVCIGCFRDTVGVNKEGIAGFKFKLVLSEFQAFHGSYRR